MRQFISIVSTLILMMLFLVLLSGATTFQTTSSPTPTPFAMRSLFSDDSCAPPCWFGLTPGESTPEDVSTFFAVFGDLMYGVAPPIHEKDENYLFYWKPANFNRENVRQNNYIRVYDGIVDAIHITMNETVYLAEVLEKLGMPDSIIFELGFYGSAYLNLVYLKPRIRVHLTAEWETCFISNIGESFWVDSIGYYSPAYQLVYTIGEDRFVPEITWQTWLDGEVNGNCQDAWQQLPVITATLSPTQTVVATATSEPR